MGHATFNVCQSANVVCFSCQLMNISCSDELNRIGTNRITNEQAPLKVSQGKHLFHLLSRGSSSLLYSKELTIVSLDAPLSSELLLVDVVTFCSFLRYGSQQIRILITEEVSKVHRSRRRSFWSRRPTVMKKTDQKKKEEWMSLSPLQRLTITTNNESVTTMELNRSS